MLIGVTLSSKGKSYVYSLNCLVLIVFKNFLVLINTVLMYNALPTCFSTYALHVYNVVIN